MENNINDNLRSRLNEIKNGESVNDIISDTESKNNNDNNIMDEHIPDMSRIRYLILNILDRRFLAVFMMMDL